MAAAFTAEAPSEPCTQRNGTLGQGPRRTQISQMRSLRTMCACGQTMAKSLKRTTVGTPASCSAVSTAGESLRM